MSPSADMEIKTNRKFGITQRFNIEDTKGRSQSRVMEVKKVKYGETL